MTLPHFAWLMFMSSSVTVISWSASLNRAASSTGLAAEFVPASDPIVAAAIENVAPIPRNALFDNPDKAMARISPDGKLLSYLAPVNGVLNVFVGPVDNPDMAKPVTKDTKRGIRQYFWAFTNRHILFLQDVGGDEDWHVYSVNLDSGEIKDLTPFEKVAAQIEQVSHRSPEHILIGLNQRNPQFHDIFKVNLHTGERTLVQENPGFAGFLSDEDYNVRFAMRFTEDGGNEILKPADGGKWEPFAKVPMEDTLTTSPIGFDKSGQKLYLMDSRGRDTGALAAIDLKTEKQQVLAANPKADVGGVMMHPTENTVQAVSFNYDRKEWLTLDEQVKKDLAYLQTVADGDIEVPSRTLDDRVWIVAYLMDNGPIRYYLYDRDKSQTKFLFTNRKSLEGLPLAKMHAVVLKSRDGFPLISYLTLPIASDPDGDGRPKQPLPMVLDVHGGPWARDTWGYNPAHQLWANRGYAVLSVNFRGSTGFGKKFTNAGNKEWAGKMHEDLLDAVEWATQEKIADPKKVAIMGGSYGGYATLVGLTFTPQVFACGVDIVGPSNIETLLKTIPPYWAPALQMFKDRVGDHTTDDGRKFLSERSPLSFVERIERPLLIGQGANDPRVKQSEADQIVKAMQSKNIPVTYVLYGDEGHGFARPENSLSFNAVTEAFLARHLGGRYEKIGDAFKNSSIAVPAGAEGVPSLAEALKAHEASTLPPPK